jgi:hypothetical protein
MHDDRMISLGRSSDDPNQDGLAKSPDPAQNLRSGTSPRSLRRNDHFRFWPNAELVQRLPSRQLLGVKRTRCAKRRETGKE